VPALADDLHRSNSVAAGLVSLFALSSFIVTPLTAIVFYRLDIARLLFVAAATLSVVAFAGALSHALWELSFVAVTAGAAAGVVTIGLYSVGSRLPTAARILYLFQAGSLASLVIGTPIFLSLPASEQPRAFFITVALLAALSGVMIGRHDGNLEFAASRVQVGRVLLLTSVTFITTTAGFAVYPFLPQLVGGGWHPASVYALFGIAATAATFAAIVRPPRSMATPLVLLALIALSMTLLALDAPPLLHAFAVAGWASAGFAFLVPVRLALANAGGRGRLIILALNASATYIGIACGTAVGWRVAASGIQNIPAIAAPMIVLSALIWGAAVYRVGIVAEAPNVLSR